MGTRDFHHEGNEMRTRIRTIKPEFYQHKDLYQLEKTARLPIRIAFAGLLAIADREGRFEWKADIIKLHVLPWDRCDFEKVLDALAGIDLIRRYEIDGKVYGFIPTFKKHQVINSREASSVIPPVPCMQLHVHSRDCLTVTNYAQGELEGKGTGKELKGIEQNGREGERGRETVDARTLSLQEELERRRLAEGLNRDGTQRGAWNEARA